MKVILLGATGMIGQGVLRECLLDARVERVLVVGRAPTGKTDPKLREILRPDLFDLSGIEDDLCGYDACLFCLGVSSAGMSEAEYRRMTYDLTVSVAQVLAAKSPGMTFLYVSGAGTDSSGRGRSMWARVKGQTENALLAMPFRAAYMFRPGFIQPMHGIRSRTVLYRAVYAGMTPLAPLVRAIAPGLATTTERFARAMLRVARDGAQKKLLETRDINELGAAAG
jgi:uncharacterized protein YbjT (DUF2867 family)